MTYLITFSCYGTHLHGDERGSIDRRHKGALARARGPEPALEAFERTEMPQPAYFLDERRRAIVLQAIRDACLRRNWDLCAVHIRTEHLHAVVQADAPAARVAQQLKAYSSQALNQAGIDLSGRLRWTRGFSVRTLFDREARLRAIRYVINQGEPMALYVAEERARA